MTIIVGSNGSDTVNGSSGSDLIISGNGNDTINAGAGSDIVIAGNGNDTVDGGAGNDLILAGNGNDTVNGGSGNDIIDGGNGNDILNGGSGDDIIFGGNGNDLFIHNVTENIDLNNCTTDFYDGERGTDTLKLVVTASQLADLQAAINAFAAWNKNYVFDFKAYVPYVDLKVIHIEKLIVEVIGSANQAPTNILLSAAAINENADGAIIGALSVVDPNAGDTHTYTVSDARFEVVAGQLKLKAGQSLNFEVEPSVNLNVTATDNGGLSVTKAFVITVNNVNEAPVLSADTLTPALDENMAGAILANLSVADPDAGDTHTYVVSDARFEVVAGQLKLKDGISLDHEAEPTVNLSVTVTDAGGLSDTQNFVITVNNLNDNAPVLTVNQLVAAVDENAANIVMATLSATDADGNALTYSLSGADAAKFAIQGNNLVLISPVDYEAQQNLNVILTVSDGLPANDQSQALSFAVNNLNEAPVLSADTLTPALDENMAGAILANLSVADPDAGDTHTYTVSDARFEVVNGQLKLKDGISLDHEVEPTVAVDVTATDAGGLSDTQNFVITVNNVNEPSVIGGQDSGSVTEDSVLVATGTLTIADPEGQNSFLAGSFVGTYGFLSITALGAWTYNLNNSSPAIQALNTGQSLEDHIVIFATDGTTHTIDVTINGVDEPVPFNPYVFDYLVPETHAVRSLQILNPATGGTPVLINNMPDATLKTLGAVLDFSINANNHYQFSLDNPNFNFGQAEITNVPINASANNAVASATPIFFNIDTSTNGIDASQAALVLNDNRNIFGGDFSAPQTVSTANQTVNYGSQLIYGLGGDDLLAGDILSPATALASYALLGTGTNNTYNFGSNILHGGVGNDIMAGSVLLSGSVAVAGIQLSTGVLNFGSNTLYGGAGNDQLFGDVFGGDQNIVLTSTTSPSTVNFAANTMEGGSGDDLLNGNVQSITIDRGTVNIASNTFVYDFSESGGLGNDVIRDFKGISGDSAQTLISRNGAITIKASGDVLEFHHVFDANNDGVVNISDLVALTNVVNDGGGHAKIEVFNDTAHTTLLGTISLPSLNVISVSGGVAPVLNQFYGVAFVAGQTEITDYSDIHVAIV